MRAWAAGGISAFAQPFGYGIIAVFNTRSILVSLIKKKVLRGKAGG